MSSSSSASSLSSQTSYELICHPLFLSVAGGLNLPPLVFGAIGFATWCDSFSTWLVGNACFTGLNMVAALYSVYMIRRTANPIRRGENNENENDDDHNGDNADGNGDGDNNETGRNNTPSSALHGGDIEKDDEDTDSNNASSEFDSSSSSSSSSDDGNRDPDQEQSSVTAPRPKHHHHHHRRRRGCFSRLVELKTISSDRIRHLICYNGIVATYSVLFLVWVFWLSEGTQDIKQFRILPEEDSEGCEDFHERYTYVSLVCGFSYFSFVMIAVMVSLCTR